MSFFDSKIVYWKEPSYRFQAGWRYSGDPILSRGAEVLLTEWGLGPAFQEVATPTILQILGLPGYVAWHFPNEI